jgi:hypothetical protein
MFNKKLFLIVALGLLLAQNSFAQRTVPKNQPLQPANQPEIFDFSQNVNSEPESPFYQPPPVENTEEETTETGEGTNEETSTPTDTVTTASSPVTTYWILLFIGIGGIMGILIWVYLRFVH